eukprot:3916404-Prymnesium_polylepis.2
MHDSIGAVGGIGGHKRLFEHPRAQHERRGSVKVEISGTQAPWTDVLRSVARAAHVHVVAARLRAPPAALDGSYGLLTTVAIAGTVWRQLVWLACAATGGLTAKPEQSHSTSFFLSRSLLAAACSSALV